jgi:hypothetical protein
MIRNAHEARGSRKESVVRRQRAVTRLVLNYDGPVEIAVAKPAVVFDWPLLPWEASEQGSIFVN